MSKSNKLDKCYFVENEELKIGNYTGRWYVAPSGTLWIEVETTKFLVLKFRHFVHFDRFREICDCKRG